ncbi:MAG: hypothetical protein JXJ04_16735 [Spirochaetales bacterium]|nr:hypothetical protein [Spirochaetales bacterium]
MNTLASSVVVVPIMTISCPEEYSGQMSALQWGKVVRLPGVNLIVIKEYDTSRIDFNI